MSEDIVPHLKLPVRLDARTGALETIEQDSLAEVAQSVEVVLATPIGSRLDLPDFGAPDYLFRQLPVDTSTAVTAVATWEPRALVVFTQRVDDGLSGAIQAAVTSRGI